MIVVDKDFIGGKLEEVTFDYFAESDDGGVYYFGEECERISKRNDRGHSGAWHYGVETNFLGLIIPGRPQVGQKFQAENVPGITKENDEIVSVTGQDQARDWVISKCGEDQRVLSDGSVEYKYYVPSVGTVTEIAPDGTVNLRQHISCWHWDSVRPRCAGKTVTLARSRNRVAEGGGL